MCRHVGTALERVTIDVRNVVMTGIALLVCFAPSENKNIHLGILLPLKLRIVYLIVERQQDLSFENSRDDSFHLSNHCRNVERGHNPPPGDSQSVPDT